MIEITPDFDPEAVLRNLDKVQRQTESLRAALPEEMDAWQEQDMKRRRANTRIRTNVRPTSNFVLASTTILPTSRWRFKKRRRLIRKRKRTGLATMRSSRPVLRPTLLQLFKQRFSDLLDRSFR
jgi:hypothetical protein